MARFASSKVTFLVAIAFAAVAGGATTAFVSAAIPDSNGVIHACRGNTAGLTRIIDNEAGQTCTALESPVSWSQNGGGDGAQAYAYLDMNANGNVELKPGYSAHFSNVYLGNNVMSCLTFDSTVHNPKQVLLTAAPGGGASYGAQLAVLDPSHGSKLLS